MAPRKKWSISTKLEKPGFFGVPKNLGQKKHEFFGNPKKSRHFSGSRKNRSDFGPDFSGTRKMGFFQFCLNGYFFRGAIFRGHFFRGGGQSTPLPRVVMFLEGPYNALKKVL